tara:strand:+ start:305 stop:1552 length:1248 start_codon:yes stop_codon:yes gene_type:complete
MNAAIVCIGDELMNGSTLNSNSAWIAREISKYYDLKIKYIETLHDDIDTIKYKLSKLLTNGCDYIFITGGLGPTHDDITKNALKFFFKSKLILEEKYYNRLISYFEKENSDIGHLKSQAQILECSHPIPNMIGTALGMYIENENSSIFVMPGVPSEMKAMMKNEVIPNYIEKKCKDKIYKKVFLTSGITESRLSNILSDLISLNSDEFKFSFLPNYSGVKFVVLSKNRNKKKYDVLCKDIRKLIKSYCYGFDNDTLSGVVGQILISKKITLSIAESCTGGMISKKITDIPNSSLFFKGSVVAYSNQIKEQILEVPRDILIKYGAVSSEVALIMAEKIKKIFNSDIGISITGISGPGGGSDNKPVGLVYIAAAYKKFRIVKQFNLLKDRDKNREISSNLALNIIRNIVSKKKDLHK